MVSKSKLFHDMNSSLTSLEQALILIAENKTDQELIDQVLPLSREKMAEILSLWEEIKNNWGKT